MTYQLLIAEKPQSALKIAQALADEAPKKHLNNKVPYYELTYKDKKIVVGCAVGHLYNLKEKNSSSWSYPFFSYEWQPAYLTTKNAKYTKIYLATLEKLSKEADSFYVCTDFDEEGSVIGERIITQLFNQKDAKRMKFSSLTKTEIVNSYENAMPHQDWSQIMAGMARHELDLLFGVNASKGLTTAVKNAGSFKILSAGRVQGPALKILVDLDKKIDTFVQVPYWQIQLLGEINNKQIEAWHKEDKFWKKEEAVQILENTKGKDTIISNITKKEFKQKPPFPFDLTTLQIEAYRTLRISPRQTLALTQNLYMNGLITYPRTSSQQIPETINYRRILQDLSKQVLYKELCEDLLKKTALFPTNGPKKDPAHPACIVTGETPKKLNEQESKLYDLIARRTLATFSDPAVRETIEIDKFYKPYLKLEEKELPNVKKSQKIENTKIESIEKETQPPKRYTPASLIKKLEQLSLGTKTTRSIIIDILYQRQYIEEKTIETTQLGKVVASTLEKYVPDLVSEKLTRHFEMEMEQIRQGKKKKEEILEEAKEALKKIFNEFQKNEDKIGNELLKAIKQTRDKDAIVGECQNCKSHLKITYSKKNRSYFIACSAYPNCKTTFSLPYGLPKTTEKKCKECNFSLIRIIRKNARPYEYCFNKSCPKKENWLKQQQGNIKVDDA